MNVFLSPGGNSNFGSSFLASVTMPYKCPPPARILSVTISIGLDWVVVNYIIQFLIRLNEIFYQHSTLKLVQPDSLLLQKTATGAKA